MRYNYTTDWNPSCRYSWLSLLNTFKDKTNLQFLEIGCWEGRTTNWLLDNFLTHISSKITVIDTFKGSEEEPGMRNQDLLTIRERFNHNTSAHSKKINVLEGFSNHRLKELGNEPLYDFVFIDGTHTSYGTLEDAVLIHPLVKPGGIIIFDDYMWINHDSTSPTDSPKLGIDSFLENYCDFYKILDKKVQVTIQKNN
tara:strand:- start:463 stop:1053 length:591 start_codon:yes stop_codon:yes gene_type:complete